MRYFVTGFLGGVSGNLAEILGARGNVFAGVFDGVVSHVVSLFSAIGGLNCECPGAAIDVRYAAFCNLEATYADAIYLLGGLSAAFSSEVHYHFAALFQAVECIFRAGGDLLGTVNSGMAHDMKRVLSAIGRFDDDGFGHAVGLLDYAVDRADHVFCRGGKQTGQPECQHHNKRPYHTREYISDGAWPSTRGARYQNGDSATFFFCGSNPSLARMEEAFPNA